MGESSKNCGIIIKRKDIVNPVLQYLHAELLLLQLETQLMLLAIMYAKKRHFSEFDGLAGDQKCQIRASMIQDLFHNYDETMKILQEEEDELTLLLERLGMMIVDLDVKNPVFVKQNKDRFKVPCVSDFINTLGIDFKPSTKLKLLSLCLVTKLSKYQLHNMSIWPLSKNKIDKLVESAKITLCDMTIAYERKLAQDYNDKEAQQALNQIECKAYSCAFSSMTAFFPSWHVVWNKMKHHEQIFMVIFYDFCGCGGIRATQTEFFAFRENKLVRVILGIEYTKDVIMVMLAYRYQGSFESLTTVLKMQKQLATTIPESLLYKCQCFVLEDNQQIGIERLEQRIKGVFAQHSQFINNANIQWNALGLQNSDLKKEFDFLTQLSGLSLKDMSDFLIVHIYASTMSQVLQEQRVLQEQLEQGVVNVSAEK